VLDIPCHQEIFAGLKSSLFFTTVLFCFLWMTCPLPLNIFGGLPVCLTDNGIVFAAQTLTANVSGGMEQLKSIQKAKDSHEDKLHAIEGKKLELLGELERLDREMNFLYGVLEQKKQAKESNINLLQQIESEYNKKKRSADNLKKHAQVRLKAFWNASQTGMLNVLFGSRTVPELLSKEMYLRYFLQKDRELLSDYRKEMAQLRQTQKRLGQETSLLKQTEKDIQQQAAALERKLRQKKNLLAGLSSDEVKQKKMIAELEEAESRLQKMMASVVSAKKDADSQKPSAVPGGASAPSGLHAPLAGHPSVAGTGFAGQRGRLAWPAMGRVFRPKGVASHCILIELPIGAEVKAVYEGQVVYSGSLTGYGNAVILDHGDGYYTMTAQCMRILKQINDKVFEGENICTSGGGPWIAEGIYFEIRDANGQEDALSWLDARSIAAFQKGR
jgi:septal ring factor EnvC (AmiA/AmiB activator)